MSHEAPGERRRADRVVSEYSAARKAGKGRPKEAG
jgi:hypothetical protein